MKKAVIFGAGQLGKKIYEDIHEIYEVVAFLDNYRKRQEQYLGGDCPKTCYSVTE